MVVAISVFIPFAVFGGTYRKRNINSNRLTSRRKSLGVQAVRSQSLFQSRLGIVERWKITCISVVMIASHVHA